MRTEIRFRPVLPLVLTLVLLSESSLAGQGQAPSAQKRPVAGVTAARDSGGVRGDDTEESSRAGIQRLIEGDALKGAMHHYLTSVGPMTSDPSWAKAKARLGSEAARTKYAEDLASPFAVGDSKCRDMFPGGKAKAWTEVGMPGTRVCFDLEGLFLDFQARQLGRNRILTELAAIAFHELTHHFQDRSKLGNPEVERAYENEAQEVENYVGWTAQYGQLPTLRWSETLEAGDLDSLEAEFRLSRTSVIMTSLVTGVSATIAALTSWQFFKENPAKIGEALRQARVHEETAKNALRLAGIDFREGELPATTIRRKLESLTAASSSASQQHGAISIAQTEIDRQLGSLSSRVSRARGYNVPTSHYWNGYSWVPNAWRTEYGPAVSGDDIDRLGQLRAQSNHLKTQRSGVASTWAIETEITKLEKLTKAFEAREESVRGLEQRLGAAEPGAAGRRNRAIASGAVVLVSTLVEIWQVNKYWWLSEQMQKAEQQKR